jgi:hypothetical protein
MEAESWNGRLKIPLPPTLASASKVRLAMALVTAGAGSAYETWVAMGRPASLTRIDEEALRTAAFPRQSSRYVDVVDGCAVIEFKLERDEVLFIETLPVESGVAMGTSSEIAALNKALEYPGAE